MKIGIISDTHGFLDPAVQKLFAGVGHILHAGDIGPDSIISELEAVAPVTAVCGNTDSSSTFRPTEVVVLAGHKFLVHHIVDPYAPREELQLRIAREQPGVVVFGHTHKAFFEKRDGVWYLNPGYAGKPKHDAERSVAILHCAGKEIRVEYFQL